MIGDKLTSSLDSLLHDSNKNKKITNDEENETMAKLDRDKIKNKAAENTEEVVVETPAEGAEAEVKADTKEAEVKAEGAEENLEAVDQNADDLLEQALNAVQDHTANQAGDVQKTENFTGAGAGNENTEMSEEELKKEAKAKEDAEARNKKNSLYNEFIDKQFSQLRQEAGDATLSPEQLQLNLACRTYGTHEGFLMVEGAKPVLKLARVYETENKKPKLRSTATNAELTAFQTGNKKGYKKGNVVEYKTTLRYTMATPKTCFGSVISLPIVLNEISPIDLNNNNFVVPKADVLKSSPRITVAYDAESFFSVLMTYFGGEINESERVKRTKAPITSKSFVLKGSLVPKNVQVNGEYKPVIGKQLKSKSRSSIYVQENIIPYQVYMTEDISKLSPDTKRAITESFKKQLTTTEQFSPYSFLDDAAKAAIVANVDGVTVSDVTCNIFTGSAVLGHGALKEISLRHWSDATQNPSGKYDKNVMSPVLVKHVFVENKNDSTKATAKPVKKTLGLDLSLAELGALGYPAAEALAKEGFDEQKIVDLLQGYKADVKQRRDARNLALGKTPKSVTRKSAEVDAELAARLYLNAISGHGNAEKLGMDVRKVQATMLQNSLQ